MIASYRFSPVIHAVSVKGVVYARRFLKRMQVLAFCFTKNCRCKDVV